MPLFRIEPSAFAAAAAATAAGNMFRYGGMVLSGSKVSIEEEAPTVPVLPIHDGSEERKSDIMEPFTGADESTGNFLLIVEGQ